MNPDVSEDFDLLRRTGKADQVAFERLYERYQTPIFRYCRQMTSNEGDADDLFQEIFIAVWNQARNFQQRSSIRTWMFRIAHNRLVDLYRRQRLEIEFNDENLLQEAMAASGPDEMVGDGDLQVALKQLPAGQREVIELAFFEEMSYQEIADITGCPLGTVKSRINTGVQHLAGWLKRGS